MPEQRSAKWTIERVELVLFNLEHKRWQIWQEHSPPPNNGHVDAQNRTGALFRRQVIRLLGGVRKILAESIGSVPSNQFAMDDGTGSGEVNHSGVNLTFAATPPCAPDFWHLFLDYCDLTCNKYGITDEKVRKFFQDPNFRKGDFGTSTSLTRDQAADLVSALPIARDWDLFGCWYRCWARPGDIFQFPPSGADKWHQPFYMARISQKPQSTYLETLRSTRVEAICRDLDAAVEPVDCGESDFFGNAYCVRPPENTLAGQTYLAYAFLYDNIQTAMSFNATYIISFPIEVYDRTHFLQIQIVPGKSSTAEPSLQDLWKDWHSQQQELFWAQPVKRYLEEGVERLSLAYFQSRWEEAIFEELKHNKIEVDKFNDKKDPLPLLRKSLASTAHLLVPLEAASQTTDRKLYRPFSWKKYYEWRQAQRQHSPLPKGIDALPFAEKDEHDLGAQWEDDGDQSSKDAEATSRANGSSFLTLPDLHLFPDYGRRVSVNGPGTNFPDTIVNSRILQLVDQHYHHMSFQLPQMISHIDNQRKQARDVLSRYFSDATKRRTFNGSLGGDTAEKERIEDCVLIEKTVFELMRLATGQKPGESGFDNLQHSLLQQPISEITSAFFSLGAAKTCTHVDRWTTIAPQNDLKKKSELIADLDRQIGTLGPLLQREPLLEPWINQCTQWVTDVKADIESNFKGPGYFVKKSLFSRYKMLRWPAMAEAFEGCKTATDIAQSLGFENYFGIERGMLGEPCPDMKIYFPFQNVINLAALVRDITPHCRNGTIPKISWWGTLKNEFLYKTDDKFYRVTDIALKTRVVLLRFEGGAQKVAAEIADSTELRSYFDPFAKNFGRFFIFSNSQGVEVTFRGTERKSPPYDFQAFLHEILPPENPNQVDVPTIQGDNVALAFVWRVFEEERKSANP